MFLKESTASHHFGHFAMKKIIPASLVVLFVLLSWGAWRSAPQEVLIVQDERPQVEVLADFLEEKGKLNVTMVEQDALPEDLSAYKAVLMFIHGDLGETTEEKIIDYTERGGRLVLLHHSISSGKASNEHYFDFLGIHLDNPEASSEPVEPGEGYGWRHDVPLTLVNLHSSHYITTHEVDWDEEAAYASSDAPSIEAEYPAITLEDSEVYLNHKFADGREKTVLLGMKYYDDRVDTLFMQDRAGWIKEQGAGEVIYFMPGHVASDYEHPGIAQMILNSIEWQP